MDKKKWLNYWKKSLSDSIKADIEIEKLHHFEVVNFSIDSETIGSQEKVNELIDYEENRINKKKGITDKESEDWVQLDKIQVAIAPFKIKPTTERLVFLKDKKTKLPFWFFANLCRNGKLQTPEETFPIFQRKYLEPLADERTEFIFGAVENVDNATAIGEEKYGSYSQYIKYVKDVFMKVIGQEIDFYKTAEYETISNAIVLLPDEDINAAVSIVKLYEKILKEPVLPKLLKTFITIKNEDKKRPLSVKALMDSNPMYIGQMGFDFPISISQRKGLYTYLEANDKVFAVNGPPGTGKTTLLQSIVANKFVESAILGINAPIILACSVNNQAVTNIIDSFSKSNTKEGNLQGRWLPEIEGYATYLPAVKKTEIELKGINYKKLDGNGLFRKIENRDFLNAAKDCYIAKSETYFGLKDLKIEDATRRLQNKIIEIQSILKNASLKWKEYINNENVFLSKYLNQNSNVVHYYESSLLKEAVIENDIKNLNQLEEKVIRYFNNEPFFRKLFCFFGLKHAVQSRTSEVKIILRDTLIEVGKDFVFTKGSILEKLDTKIKIATEVIISIRKWKTWKTENSIIGNPPKNEDQYWDFELSKIKNKLLPNCFYDELDVSLRHKAFQLALHFWEGKYLLKLESDLTDQHFDGKGLEPVKNRWQRQAMLTPCFVSTFYMAPKFFSSYKFLKKLEDGRNIYDNPPLFDFIDLLIVDEAGQVSPEVGIATFALAKQAVVVGDVKQIEPIWKITNKIDIGNLKKCELIKDYNDLVYEREFDQKGFLSSTGSLMKMAQNACSFKEEGLVEKGVILVEHRRCYDEIINYCNVLAYNGQLIPLKGKSKDLLFPPMYCIHVDGNSIVSNSSRYNDAEVTAIVKWMLKNKMKIEQRYGKLEDVVGIITPFSEQKYKLKHALLRAGFNVDKLKLGTVHALQGAEKNIVLFSMVYGPGDSAVMFFDRENKPNMLNVAVSRAKDNFIVFANTEIFDKRAKTPSGLLANHLVYGGD